MSPAKRTQIEAIVLFLVVIPLGVSFILADTAGSFYAGLGMVLMGTLALAFGTYMARKMRRQHWLRVSICFPPSGKGDNGEST